MIANVGLLCHESYCWYSVERILLAPNSLPYLQRSWLTLTHLDSSRLWLIELPPAMSNNSCELGKMHYNLHDSHDFQNHTNLGVGMVAD